MLGMHYAISVRLSNDSIIQLVCSPFVFIQLLLYNSVDFRHTVVYTTVCRKWTELVSYIE